MNSWIEDYLCTAEEIKISDTNQGCTMIEVDVKFDV